MQTAHISNTWAGESRFYVGQLVVHQQFGYRGVVVDVDAEFSDTDAWSEELAISRSPRDQPWYRVLRDGSAHETYVAQRNLSADPCCKPIRHPLVWHYFEDFRDGVYFSMRRIN
ncbi:MAG: heat shock protein HspQ [Gammaproteobacteria bacterium]